MRTRTEYKRIVGEELVEVLMLALKIENDNTDDELSKLEAKIREYVIDGKTENTYNYGMESGFSALCYLGDQSEEEKDYDYLNYKYSVEIDGRKFEFTSSSYIKDHSICDEEYDFDSLTEIIEHEISEREFLLEELNKANAKIEKQKKKLVKAQEKYDKIAKELDNLKDNE